MLNRQIQALKCKEWADSGFAFSIELLEANLEMFNLLESSNSYFSIANAIALTWTKHAKFEKEFIKLAADHFDGYSKFDFEMAEMFKYRFGSESLFNAIDGLSSYINKIRKITPDFKSCSAKDLKKFQDTSFVRLVSMKNKHEAYGVGPWLFLGPFKIILGIERRLWEQPEIDSIILPSGVEVCRGIKKIIKSGYPVCESFEESYLYNEEKSLTEGYTIDTLVHGLLSDIARIGETRCIHINSAFYLYGSE